MGNEQAREEKIIEETATKETQLECPVLVDLEHGTIRHRHEDRLLDEHNLHNSTENTNAPIKVGYFYHPKLTDFSEDALSSGNNRLKYVFTGPSKAKGKKLYYIYGTDLSDKDKGIHHEEYRPQGKGYNWPQSYRKANNLYYDVIFTEKGSEEEEDPKDKVSESFGSDDATSQTSGIIIDKDKPFEKENIRLKLRPTETVSIVCERISLQLLIPSSNIHLLWNKKELSKNDLIADLNEEKKSSSYVTIHLRLT